MFKQGAKVRIKNSQVYGTVCGAQMWNKHGEPISYIVQLGDQKLCDDLGYTYGIWATDTIELMDNRNLDFPHWFAEYIKRKEVRRQSWGPERPSLLIDEIYANNFEAQHVFTDVYGTYVQLSLNDFMASDWMVVKK